MKSFDLRSRLLNLSPPLIFFLVLLLFYPFSEAFQHDSDEGVNLMKAYMVHQGYALYDEIWSDQPPLLTIAIRLLIDLFGNSVALIRTFILLISSTMLLAVYQTIKTGWPTAYAVIGAILLFFHPSYVKLSTSIMVGLPSIAFAFLSLFFLSFWHRDRKYLALVLSAVMLTISVGIKLFTGFLGVIIVGGLLLAEYIRAADRKDPGWVQILKPAFLWGLVFSAGILSILVFLVGTEHAGQLAGSHLSGTALEEFQTEDLQINYHLRNLTPTFFLAALGVYTCIREKKWFFLYFAAWSIISYLLLLNHAPVWYHHQILVSAPAAVLAAIAVGKFFTQVREYAQKPGQMWLFLASWVGIILLFFDFHNPNFIQQFRPIPADFPTVHLELTHQQEILMGHVIALQPQTNWFMTDLPMYAFYTGLPVPPDFAAFTTKRFSSGELTEAEIIAAVDRYAPEQILFGRRAYPDVEKTLGENYVLIEDFGGEIRYYVRRDLAALLP